MTSGSGCSLGLSLVDEVNLADQLQSELNSTREPGRYGVAPGFQVVVVVRPLANFPILYLQDRYASRTNWHFSQTPAQKRLALGRRKRPFTNDAVSAAEDGVGFSLGIRAAFTYLRTEFGNDPLVFEFDSECNDGD